MQAGRKIAAAEKYRLSVRANSVYKGQGQTITISPAVSGKIRKVQTTSELFLFYFNIFILRLHAEDRIPGRVHDRHILNHWGTPSGSPFYLSILTYKVFNGNVL
jgi:hypothetical protein